MNASTIDRTVLRKHVGAIEQKHPLRIIGLLPRGSAAHIFGDDALDFFAEKKPGLSLLGLCKAESDLGDRLGHEVGIVLISGLLDREAEEFPKLVEPI